MAERTLKPAALKPAAVVAALVAFVVSSQIQLSMWDHGHDFWRIFLWQFGGLTFWVLVSPWLLRSGALLLRPESRRRGWILREATKALLLTMAHLPYVALVFFILQPYEPVTTHTFSQSLTRALRTWVHLDLLTYGIALAAGYGVESYRRTQRLELRQSKLDAELAKAQLESLRLQIQPHFLFNTLNSIAAQVRRQRNERALEMLVALGDLLRTTLEQSDQARVPLHDELQFIRLYVDLQQARYADRLSVTYDVDENCLEELVPTLVLQPLVENAIRHGIAPRVAPGHIHLAAGRVGQRLEIRLEDDGVGLAEDFDLDRDAGVGLGNTRSRIEQLYGGDASFEIEPRPNGGTAVTLSLPALPTLPTEGREEMRKAAAA